MSSHDVAPGHRLIVRRVTVCEELRAFLANRPARADRANRADRTNQANRADRTSWTDRANPLESGEPDMPGVGRRDRAGSGGIASGKGSRRARTRSDAFLGAFLVGDAYLCGRAVSWRTRDLMALWAGSAGQESVGREIPGATQRARPYRPGACGIGRGLVQYVSALAHVLRERVHVRTETDGRDARSAADRPTGNAPVGTKREDERYVRARCADRRDRPSHTGTRTNVPDGAAGAVASRPRAGRIT